MSLIQPIESFLQQINTSDAVYRREVITDFWICLVSRECSLLGRKEVLTGKAKFGILGDGKEVPQVAMARAFQKGDFRSGYYRDQTFLMALGLCSVKDFFAQLYADVNNDPFSKGRQMNAHFATPLLSSDGNWLDHSSMYNVTADISSTAGQMARALGIALASKMYKQSKTKNGFSDKGREVSFCTIGDASTSEGIFWETMNAAAVMQVPLAVSVWDDGYGISVPKELQTAKGNISEALAGFQQLGTEDKGINIYKAKAWDYPALVKLYTEAVQEMRKTHRPSLFHIEEVTQPQGHSTSGSHERYKSTERLAWELEFDCIKIMGEWLTRNKLLNKEDIEHLNAEARTFVRSERNAAWENYQAPMKKLRDELLTILENEPNDFVEIAQHIRSLKDISVHEILAPLRRKLLTLPGGSFPQLKEWLETKMSQTKQNYASDLTSYDPFKEGVAARYSDSSSQLSGYQVLNQYFDQLIEKNKTVYAFGEDVGQIGDVNQGFSGLQQKYGVQRIFDTGIREWSIIGQAIGMSMRGLKPIAEIQYLDYIVYAMSALMDDLATVRYRSAGMQKAPAIIRTRGHRLEGIWHSGSPIGMLLHSLRGIHVCVPRNMVQAAGMYQTLMECGDPGLIIECLNGYRLKELRPDNLGTFSIPLGKIEILNIGSDITLITYGSCVKIAQEATDRLSDLGISVELIDAQTLLPFDVRSEVTTSIKKTNKLLILDEDVPGGASAYLLREIMETQGAFEYLDTKPICLSAAAHRPPYGSDGDYFSKPSVEDVMEAAIGMMREYDPQQFA
ncbi:MAG: transketolase [Saprospiraceae bacterium]|nr:transketolase [Saprospiraceae bacterium]MBK7796684.1 transketolase [Saprospiraceae bacterium]MBK8152599.1 transketolase [Saprospiraceae bacterium]MBL0259926.1 transketolase [Saprospiraceae bacterium]